MNKLLVILMICVMGIILCPKAAVLAEDAPGDEMPELYNTADHLTVFDIGRVNLDEEPEPETEPAE